MEMVRLCLKADFTTTHSIFPLNMRAVKLGVSLHTWLFCLAILDLCDLVGVMVEASGGIPGGVGGALPEVMLEDPKVLKSKSSGSKVLFPVFCT